MILQEESYKLKEFSNENVFKCLKNLILIEGVEKVIIKNDLFKYDDVSWVFCNFYSFKLDKRIWRKSLHN